MDEDPASVRGIYVVNADGTGRRLLVRDAAEPAWSPNGSKLAYVAYRVPAHRQRVPDRCEC